MLHHGDIVAVGNLPAYKVAGVQDAIEAAGPRLLYLPADSPDFNPIRDPQLAGRVGTPRLAFAKFKALLRTAAARTIQDFRLAIRQAFTRFTSQECRNCLAAAGCGKESAIAT